MTSQKKITLSTLKSFIRKNAGNLYVKHRSDFDGMTDCGQSVTNPQYRLVTEKPNFDNKHTLGIGLWLVGSSRDYLYPSDENGFEGIYVSNCCGSFVVGVKK